LPRRPGRRGPAGSPPGRLRGCRPARRRTRAGPARGRPLVLRVAARRGPGAGPRPEWSAAARCRSAFLVPRRPPGTLPQGRAHRLGRPRLVRSIPLSRSHSVLVAGLTRQGGLAGGRLIRESLLRLGPFGIYLVSGPVPRYQGRPGLLFAPGERDRQARPGQQG